jgi:hypothetical protein
MTSTGISIEELALAARNHGIPEFQSRRRFLAPGRHLLSGRAWSGRGSSG